MESYKTTALRLRNLVLNAGTQAEQEARRQMIVDHLQDFLRDMQNLTEATAILADGLQISLIGKQPKQLLTVQEAALHANVEDSTIRRWIKEKKLPATKAGKKLLIGTADLSTFLQGDARKVSIEAGLN